MTAPKRVLVTGGTGFIGANLVRRLLESGHHIHLLTHPDADRWRLAGIHSELALHAAQLGDPEAVGPIVARIRPEWVFHLAAYGSSSVETEAARMVAVNVWGSFQLLAAAARAGCQAFVQAGSSSEYGFKDHAPGEDEAIEPNSLYGATKAAATLILRQLAGPGLAVTTLRLYSVFGPFERPIRLIPALILAGLEGRLPPLADPRTCRDFVHVDDAVEAFVRAANAPAGPSSRIYNVGTGVGTTLGEVVEIARRELGIAEMPIWGSMPNRSWDTRVWVADSRRIHRELGWQPSHDFEAGFARTVAWFRSQPAWLPAYRIRSAAGR